MNEQKFVNWDGLVYYDGRIKDFVENNIAECLKFGGIIKYSELPHPSYETVNYTYTIEDGFISDNRFLESGLTIAPKTTVQVVEIDGIYRYSVFKEEEVNLQPVYQDIEILRTQLDDNEDQLDELQRAIDAQELEIDQVNKNQTTTTVEVEELSSTVEKLEGTIQSIEDQYDRTDERVDGLTVSVLNVSNNVSQLTETVETKADKSSLTGLASETYVQAKIAEAQLNSDGEVDLSLYVTQEQMNTKLEEIQESIMYGDF